METERQAQEEEEFKTYFDRLPIEERLRVNHLEFKIPARLRELLDGFKWAIHKKKQSAVVIVDGRSGMGKTTLSFQMAKYMSESFSLDHVFFTPEEFLEGLQKAQKGDTLVFDEAMLISSRSALTAINRMVIIAMSMIRSKNLFIIFNVNSIFDLDKNLALSRADLLLNCYGDSLTDKGKFLAFFKGGDGMDRIKSLYLNGKKFYSYAKPRSNFNSTFSSHFVLDDDEYEVKKQIGVNNFLGGKKGGLTTRAQQKWTEQRNTLIEYAHNKGETQQTIADMLGIARSAVGKVLNKPKEEEKQEFEGMR